MRDVVDRAKNSLNTYDYAHAFGCDPMYPAELIRGLVAEVERLRWQYAHGDSDHMCDECWPG